MLLGCGVAVGAAVSVGTAVAVSVGRGVELGATVAVWVGCSGSLVPVGMVVSVRVGRAVTGSIAGSVAVGMGVGVGLGVGGVARCSMGTCSIPKSRSGGTSSGWNCEYKGCTAGWGSNCTEAPTRKTRVVIATAQRAAHCSNMPVP